MRIWTCGRGISSSIIHESSVLMLNAWDTSAVCVVIREGLSMLVLGVFVLGSCVCCPPPPCLLSVDVPDWQFRT